MGFRFLGQPFPGGEQIGGVVGAALGEAANDAAWFVTAWGKQSGLSRLAPELERFRERGGTAEAVLGVDEGGATIEGLKLALALFDSVWIFHDPGARTFHPKMYVVQGERQATALVGSGNLTKGGLFTNYEAAVAASLDLGDGDDAAFLADCRTYFERLLDSGACRPLSESLIDELRSDPRVRLVSERQANRERARRRGRRESGESVFGSTALTGLLGAPDPGTTPLEDEEEDDDDLLGAPEPVTAGEGEPAEVDSDAGPTGFFKALSNNDVSLRGSPGQIIIPIAFLPFFGELEVQKDETATGGVRQSHREFPAIFRDGESETEVDDARVILYEPATDHKRQNKEVRFTFHNREILKSLSKDEVLLFSREEGRIVVERRPAGWRPPGVGKRYGLI